MALSPNDFTNILIDSGFLAIPQIIVEKSMTLVPMCSKNFRMSAAMTLGLFNKPATYEWSLVSF
jgi:hypothetical protein